MQRLLDFLKRGRYFLLLLLLEAVGFLLVCAQYDYHKSLWVGIWGDAGYAMSEKAGAWRRHFSYARENARLAQENARLRSLLSRDDKRMEALPYPGDTLRADSAVYSYIPATVVKNSYTGERNYLVLDRGQKDGVEPDMGVVTADGVLGVVVQVTPRYSVCRSILHTDSYISARFAKNEYFGRIEWDGKDRRYVHLVNIPRQAEVAVGDTVITDRRSTLFPEGLLVGTVEEAEVGDASDFYDIRVRLADDLAAVRHVYILRYKYKDELQEALQYDD